MINGFVKFVLLFIFLLLLAKPALASGQNSYVSVVNPVRGDDFWDLKNQTPADSFKGESAILKSANIPATWLIRFDGLGNGQITSFLKGLSTDEKGIFLEITPTWAKEAAVTYHSSGNWHASGTAFLSGYSKDERVKLLDTAFTKFKEVFGFYPKSVGAWWVDSFSLQYLQQKYGVVASLMVADQYTTDDYQIWGQYWSTPYYPAKQNVLHPASSLENKLPVVLMQWAARDPLNGYGNGVEESTFSVQANDYLDYHDLNTGYFARLVDLYTKQPLNKFGQIVVGLENSYSWEKYGGEYQKQIKALVEKQNSGQFKVVTMADFASWYSQTFPDLSPQQVISTDDLLGNSRKVVWFMNPYYRAGLFIQRDGIIFRDVRQYVDGEEEPCLQKGCQEINFATSATRVLDDVSFGQKLILDEGKVTDFSVKQLSDKLEVSYKNEAGKISTIDFLSRDIAINGKVSSIDSLILEATKNPINQKGQNVLEKGFFKWSLFDVLIKTLSFLGFLILGCLVPGLVVLNKTLPAKISNIQKNILAIILGFPFITVLFYLAGILKIRQVIYLYLLVNCFFLFKFRRQIFSNIDIKIKNGFNLLVIGIIGVGTIFQQLPTFKNGLQFPYGFGFWGPNSHDGVWHLALINQLIKTGSPVQNPIFSGTVLKNYHYFYDLLVALTSYVIKVPATDLLFRFYPIIFSLLLGISSYFLISNLFNNKKATVFGLYLIYFAGSFGWIVEYIKQRHLGGESAFWANQSISFNLNPPFATSLLIVISILQLLPYIKGSRLITIVLIILSGTLISFKAYGAIIVLLTFLVIGVLKKQLSYISVFFFSSIVAAGLLFSNFSLGQQLIIFSPFWFIHSMIDSPDRVGWTRLSLTRIVGLETRNWFKYLAAETASFVIFVIGNMGTRFLALFSLLKIKTILANTQYLFLFVFSAIALFIPIIFIQAGNPWNTIQFAYYFLYVASIIGGLFLSRISFLPLLIVFLLLTPINCWATANGYLPYPPHAYISNKEYSALEFLKGQPEGVVLTYPYDSGLKTRLAEPWPILAYDSTAYVSAFAAKSVYVADEPQNQILLTDYKKRIISSKDFFLNPAGGSKFLESNNIKYIYLPKIFNVRIDESADIKNIFENGEVIIYKYKN